MEESTGYPLGNCVPHVVFTGGEPTLVEFLRLNPPRGIKRSNYRHQYERQETERWEFCPVPANAGLDHVQITLESHDPGIHDEMVCASGAWQDTVSGIRNVLSTRLYMMTNSTLLQLNSPYLKETLEFLASWRPNGWIKFSIYSGHGESVGTGLNAADLLLRHGA